MIKPHTHERRKFLRIPVAARIRIDDRKEEIWFTQDISEGGLFLKTENPPFVGTIMKLEISLPDVPKLVLLKGDVIWRHDGKGCGIRFLRITKEQRKVLRTFIEGAEEGQEGQ